MYLPPYKEEIPKVTPPEPCAEPLDAAGDEETPCPKREDGTHCVHWWDGDAPCCACGSGAQS